MRVCFKELMPTKPWSGLIFHNKVATLTPSTERNMRRLVIISWLFMTTLTSKLFHKLLTPASSNRHNRKSQNANFAPSSRWIQFWRWLVLGAAPPPRFPIFFQCSLFATYDRKIALLGNAPIFPLFPVGAPRIKIPSTPITPIKNKTQVSSFYYHHHHHHHLSWENLNEMASILKMVAILDFFEWHRILPFLVNEGLGLLLVKFQACGKNPQFFSPNCRTNFQFFSCVRTLDTGNLNSSATNKCRACWGRGDWNRAKSIIMPAPQPYDKCIKPIMQAS